MNKLFKSGIWVIFAVLITANVFTFMSGMSLSDQINHFEQETTKLHQENIDLETEVYNSDSLSTAQSKAEAMHFTQQANPVYLENLEVALNR